MNLVGAIRTAAAPAARGKGVLVCLNDEIQAARDVTKTRTCRLQTFRSGVFGALGHVEGEGVFFYRAPTRRSRLIPSSMCGAARACLGSTSSSLMPARMRP